MRWLKVLLLTACTEFVWVRPNSTRQDFSRDKYACVQESRTSWSGGGTGLAGQVAIASARAEADREATDLFHMCMEARGWHLEERGGGGALAAEVMFPVRRQPPQPDPKNDPNWGFTGDACGPLVACQGARQCVDGKCSETR